MTSPIPIVGAPVAAGTDSSGTPNTPSNTLGPKSFITLLTAQLQAQDPLSPMDPNQMVSELTSINTLQQLVQIRSDMDTLVSAMQKSQSGSGSGAGNGGATGSGGAAGSGGAPSAGATNPSSQALAKLFLQHM